MGLLIWPTLDAAALPIREQDPDEAPQCSNGLDDDADGVTDFPYEPGCSAAGDDDESDPDMAPSVEMNSTTTVMATDFPNDPGCAGIGDRDETDPSVQPFAG